MAHASCLVEDTGRPVCDKRTCSSRWGPFASAGEEELELAWRMCVVRLSNKGVDQQYPPYLLHFLLVKLLLRNLRPGPCTHVGTYG